LNTPTSKDRSEPGNRGRVVGGAVPAEEVFIALGSNIGDSETIIEEAIVALGQISGCSLRARSSLYRSAALGDTPQDDYINAVVLIDTELEPLALLLELQAIEHAYYRNRDHEQRWAPRTLDLDIILFGNRSVDDSRTKSTAIALSPDTAACAT
jgi:2-amino-4-hydroxy-6-hydroxymethyldihydropteridine diphosphokinase